MNIEVDMGDLVRHKETGSIFVAMGSSIHPAGDWCDSEVTIVIKEIATNIATSIDVGHLRAKFEVLVPMSLDEI